MLTTRLTGLSNYMIGRSLASQLMTVLVKHSAGRQPALMNPRITFGEPAQPRALGLGLDPRITFGEPGPEPGPSQGLHRMLYVNRALQPRTETRYLYEDSFHGRARAGTRAHYARARYMNRPKASTV